MTKFQTLSAALKATMAFLLRRPGHAVGGAIGALAVVAAFAFAAQGLPGRGDGPDPAPLIQVGNPSSPGPGRPGPTSAGVESDQEDSGSPADLDRDGTSDANHEQGGQVSDTDDAGGDSD